MLYRLTYEFNRVDSHHDVSVLIHAADDSAAQTAADAITNAEIDPFNIKIHLIGGELGEGSIHGRYADTEAISAIENEATLQFQQSTVISTKSGAGAITLESVGNALILQAGTSIRMKSEAKIYDDKKFYFGTGGDYWFVYNSSGAKLRFLTTNGDGAGSDMDIFYVQDGTDDPIFPGIIKVDTINSYTGGGWLTLSKALVGDRLHVQGSESVGGTNATIEIENTAPGGDSWYLRVGSTGTPTPAGGFSIADTTAYRFVIDQNGNCGIGIGYSTPSERLEIGGNLAISGHILPEGEVDGRDIAIDGQKLDGIESGAEVSTKEFFISAGSAILSSNASYPTPNDTYHLALADGVTFARCFFTFKLPVDFASMASGYPKIVFKQGTGGTGNYRIAFNGRAGGIGEQMGSVLDNISEYTMAAPGTSDELWEEDVSACFDGLSLAAGDYVGLQIQRDSDDSLDTFSGDLDIVGIVIKYN